MSTLIELPYGDDLIAFSDVGLNVAGIYTPRAIAAAHDPDELIRSALNAPVDSPTLRVLGSGKSNAIVLIDDITRETPADILLPPILDELHAAGLQDQNIRVMIALGTHRPMTGPEIQRKVGAKVLGRIEVIQHDYRTAKLRHLGTTPNGTPIEVNELLFESDLLIGTGAVVPHHIAGFSGGAKIIQPGVSGAVTTAATHMFSARSSTPLLGHVDTPVRTEMELIAEQCGMTHILNVTLNTDGELVTAAFGATRPTFRKLVTDAKNIYGVRTPKLLDIVIAGSHPCDIEFWQAHKSLYPALLMVRPGGTIIVVTPCPEGVSVTHRSLLAYAAEPSATILQRYERDEIPDRVGASLAVAWARVREHAHVVLVSDGITPSEARSLGFESMPDVETALATTIGRSTGQPSIGVLTHAPDTLPLVA